jgi:NAD(P)-dependent dehydrogenase (short-subunit alcohol dehydrogenase family)
MPSVLITGANRGIGLEFAHQYAAEAWRVFACCRAPQKATPLNQLMADHPGAVSVHPIEVTDPDTIAAVAKTLTGEAIDVLINNAGVAGGGGSGPVDFDNFTQTLAVNTVGPVRVAEAFADHVAASGLKTMVSITSGMGSIGDNGSGGYLAYRTSKAALNMAMRTLAHDFSNRGIITIVLNPGWVKTDMGGSGATRTPEDSISAMRKVIAGLGPQDTGKFFNYTGEEFPW